MAVALAVALAGVAWAGYDMAVASRYESTDNAYVQGDLVQITPQVAGTVLAIHAEDTEMVRAGQPLVDLDPADMRVALEQAEAQLAQTVREVRMLFANDAALQAQMALREAELARARTELARVQQDMDRRMPLVVTGAVGKEEFEHAQAQAQAAHSAMLAAQAALNAARQQWAGQSGLDRRHRRGLASHGATRRCPCPRGLSRLQTDAAGLAGGRICRQAQRATGATGAAGAALMTVVPLARVWVEANFKEGQLRRLRLGQPVTLVSDVYGSQVSYHGRIAGLGAGTGAAFSLLPAQKNATGNWIKVVQRVAGAHRARPAGAGRAPLCAWVCRWRPRWMSPSRTAPCSHRPCAVSRWLAPRCSTRWRPQAQAEVERIIGQQLGSARRSAGHTSGAHS
ncbi:MAG: hypothetical protein KatS3mg122_0821 [Caldimonas sp.]|nr:MAG: hypothetical protein KatS3mg122_0821 [Caldimonas sp.]